VGRRGDYRKARGVEKLSIPGFSGLGEVAGLEQVPGLSEALQGPDYKSDWRRTPARCRLFLYEKGLFDCDGAVLGTVVGP